MVHFNFFRCLLDIRDKNLSALALCERRWTNPDLNCSEIRLLQVRSFSFLTTSMPSYQ